ncbi:MULTISPECIES: LLM class flavin-dependent oxidoreductase [unclassified Aureimonas]|uniref:LLM class flavin-dependent oxidoreductase n=1 Tax=unclassified Aureimonas TaxID=2615206 RepID=UPI000ABB3827|nr:MULTISPECIES: LLM class flavin-dependent oxidoreductase [unclassified Aureimonas]
MPRKLILAGFFFNPQGNHRISWRHEKAPDHEVFSLDYYADLAREAERAKLDFIFLADHMAIWSGARSSVRHYANPRLEPITLLSALAAVTRDIGLVSTASTSYSEPYNLARLFASLDHLSAGRAAINIVTSAMAEEAQNYGHGDVFAHGDRYRRAEEYVRVLRALWDSWEDEALLFDRASGDFADETRVHALDHEGEFFKVRGPLNVPRPPQGHLPVFQAGSSSDGKDFAARHVDVQFVSLRSIEDALSYRADMNARLAKAGRDPAELIVLQGLQPVVAGSRAEAEDRFAHLQALQPDRLSLDLLSAWSGVDLDGVDPDGPMPPLPEAEGYKGVQTTLERVRLHAAKGLSVIEIARTMSAGGEMQFVGGTPREIADDIEAWFTSGAVDGFNLMFPHLPGDWTDFTGKVVPELQRRGLFQREYGPGTLRERLGLAPAPNLFRPALAAE